MKKLSMMDDAFLRLESRRQPLHVGMLLLFEPPANAPEDFAAQLAEKWRKSTRAAAPFNWRLVQRRGLHYWCETDDFDLAHHFVHVALPKPGRIRELLSMVSRLHCGHLDRAYPLWRMYLIEGIEDGRFAIYLKIHHAVVDGVAGMRMLLQSMATEAEASIDMPPFWEMETLQAGLEQTAPSSSSLATWRSMTWESVKSVKPVLKELRSSWNDYRKHNPNLALGGQAPRCLLNDKVTGTRRFAAQSYAMPRIKAIAKAYKATSNDVILAMCGGALRRYLAELEDLPDMPLTAGVPISVRREDSDAGNQVAFTLTHLATHMADPAERMKAIKDCMDYNKERMAKLSPGQLLTYAATMMLPGALSTLFGRKDDKTLGNVVVSHVPGPRHDMYWQGAKLSGMYPLSLIIDGGALNITVVSRHDFVDFGLIACRQTVPHVQRLLKYLDEELDALEDTVKPRPKRSSKATKTKIATRKAKSRPTKAKSTS